MFLQSILEAEVIPDLEKNPSFLSENSYEIVDQNERVVSEGPVTEGIEEQLRAGKLRVRQTPGPKNALGLIKFEFPNQYDVYMHGTPARNFSPSLGATSAMAAYAWKIVSSWPRGSCAACRNGMKPVFAPR